ncbi:MAG: dihydrodipicolinate synthase family protein [Ilumatobacteraceae bacterium]
MQGVPRGVLASVITPFAPNGFVDFDALRAHVDWLVETGVDGIVAGADVGEFFSMARVERVGVLESVRSSGQVPVIGCPEASMQQHESIELARWKLRI